MEKAQKFQEYKGMLEKYGSPLFVLEEFRLIENIQNIKETFSKDYEKFQLGYSFKTNYLRRVCEIMKEQGVSAEVIPGFEYELAKKLGFDGNQIIVNGPYKPSEELILHINDGAIINVDNLDELKKIAKIAASLNKKVDIGLRVNVTVGEQPWSKFGFNIGSGELDEGLEFAKSNENVELTGIHIHIGTNIPTPENYKKAVLNVLILIKELEKDEITIRYIDMGGGFPSKGATPINKTVEEWRSVPPIRDFAEAITGPLNRYYANKEKPLLIVEPGRFLIDDAMFILSTVFSTKYIKGIYSAFIDAGVNILPSAYYRKHEIITSSEDEEVLTDLYGPLCMQVDLIEAGIYIPRIGCDDIVKISNTGAYEMSQSMQFIRQRPATVSIDVGGEVKLCRRKETFEDITALDVGGSD